MPSKLKWFYQGFTLLWLGAIFYLSLNFIPSADLWWHLASAKYILQLRAIPLLDPFSFTAGKYLWLNHEWLAQIFFYGLYLLGGLNALQLLKFLLIAAAFALMACIARLRGASYTAALLGAFITAAMASQELYFDIRPYLFTYLFLALELYVLEKAEQEVKWLGVIPVLTLLWANMHAAFIVSLVVTGVYFIAALPRRRTAWPLAATGLLSFAASFLNPYGYKVYNFIFSLSQDNIFTQHLVEWRPLAAQTLPVGFLILLYLGLLVWYRKFKLSDFILIFLFTYLAFSAVRHLTLLYILAALPVALILQQICTILSLRLKPVMPRSAAWGLAILAAGLILLTWGFTAKQKCFPMERLSMENELFPKDAVKFIQASRLRPNMFNPYGWGGYLLWKLYPEYRVFMDGRCNTVYNAKVYEDNIYASFGYDGWEQTMQAYKINFIICDRLLVRDAHELLPLRLMKSPNWVKIYQDYNTDIYVRNIADNNRLIKFYRCFQAGNEAIRSSRLDLACGLMTQALHLVEYSPVYVARGYTYAMRKNLPAARRDFERALALDSQVKGAHFNLGELYRNLGDYPRARKEFKAELEVNPGFKPALESYRELQS